jgi:hypothetical protein
VWRLIPPTEDGRESKDENERMANITEVLRDTGSKEKHVDTDRRKNYSPAWKTTLELKNIA